MNKAEFEALIKDLEGELGLLKSRYEQWIQGIERVPPMRQKERLERRLRALRREQPNNTAMRYRFQAVFSRWTTMNTYWQRITRQIEEGTFRRDVKKAKQRQKRIEEQEKRESQPAVVLDQPLELDLDIDFDSEIGAALAALEEVPTESKKKSFAPPPMEAAPMRAAPPPPPRRPGAYPEPPPRSPGRPLPPPPVSSRGHAVVPPPQPLSPQPLPPQPLPPPTPLSPQPHRTAPSTGTAPTVSPRPLKPRVPPRTPAALRSAPQPGRFPPGRTPQPGRTPPQPGRTPPQPGRTPPQPGRTPPQPGRTPPQPGRTPPGLSDRDLQRVYDKYVDAKRQNNERVDNLSREKLAKKIRAMEPKLRQKYGSANVDFEVVVKGGRVGLKPKKKK